MAECNWDPSKHGGKACPVHGNGGSGDKEGNHKVKIEGGKYKLKYDDNSDWEDTDEETFNHVRVNAKPDFDENDEKEDFGFDEEEPNPTDEFSGPDQEGPSYAQLEAERKKEEPEKDEGTEDKTARYFVFINNEYTKKDALADAKKYGLKLKFEEDGDENAPYIAKYSLIGSRKTLEKMLKDSDDEDYLDEIEDLSEEEVEELNKTNEESDIIEAKADVDKHKWNFKDDVKTWLKDSPYELSDEDIEYIANKAKLRKK